MSKLTTSQLTVLGSIKAAKKATKKVALASAGNHITLKTLVDAGLIVANAPSKKMTEITYSITAAGNGALKVVAAAAAKAAKLAAKATPVPAAV